MEYTNDLGSKELAEQKIKSELMLLRSNVNGVGMEPNEGNLLIVGNSSIELPLTVKGLEVAITELKNMALENGINFEQFQVEINELINMVRNQDLETVSKNENNISQYVAGNEKGISIDNER